MLLSAKESCENAGEKVADHFADTGKMVKVGSGAERQVDDRSGIFKLMIHPNTVNTRGFWSFHTRIYIGS